MPGAKGWEWIWLIWLKGVSCDEVGSKLIQYNWADVLDLLGEHYDVLCGSFSEQLFACWSVCVVLHLLELFQSGFES